MDTLLEELDFDGYVTVHLLAKIMMSLAFITEDSRQSSKKRKREGVETRSVTTMYHTMSIGSSGSQPRSNGRGGRRPLREEPRWDAPESRQGGGRLAAGARERASAVVRSHPPPVVPREERRCVRICLCVCVCCGE